MTTLTPTQFRQTGGEGVTMEKPTPVVCAIIIRGDRVLIAQRPAGKHLALKWEPPRRQSGVGEEPSAALSREIREELGCEIDVTDELPSAVHRYQRGEIELIPFLCKLAVGSSEPHSHDTLRSNGRV